MGAGADLESIPVGKLALQIRPNGAARSGVAQGNSYFALEPGARYQYSAFVYSPRIAREILFGIQTNENSLLAVRDTIRGKDTLAVVPGEWVHITGFIDVPSAGVGGAQFWIVGWDPIADPWYIDGIELTRIGP